MLLTVVSDSRAASNLFHDFGSLLVVELQLGDGLVDAHPLNLWKGANHEMTQPNEPLSHSCLDSGGGCSVWGAGDLSASPGWRQGRPQGARKQHGKEKLNTTDEIETIQTVMAFIKVI